MAGLSISQIGLGLSSGGVGISVSITATVSPASSVLVVGQSLDETTNWATFLNTSNYATDADGETITSVVVNFIGDTPDATTALADGDSNAFSITVTDTGGNARTFTTVPRTVVYTAPVATGGLADVSLVEDSAITAINVASDFTGSGITYALSPSSAALPAGLTLATNGQITGTPTTPAAQVNIVVRGTNSGGFDDTAFGVTITVAPTAAVVDSVVADPFSAGALPFTVSATGATSGDTVYWVLVPNGDTNPIATEIASGQASGGGSPTDSGNDTWPGPFSDAVVSGIANASYKLAVVIDNGELSNVGVSGAVTVDTVAPTISSSVPADNATDIAVDSTIAITFSENIELGTGGVVLRDNDGGFAALETFNVATGSGDGGGTISRSGAVLTITPGADLANNVEHSVRIAATCIVDALGNAFAGIADDTTLSFTSVAAAPSGITLTAVGTNAGDDPAYGVAEPVDFTGVATNDWLFFMVVSSDGASGENIDGLTVEGVAATQFINPDIYDAARSRGAAFKMQCPAAAAGNSAADILATTLGSLQDGNMRTFVWKCSVNPTVANFGQDADDGTGLTASITGTTAGNPVIAAASIRAGGLSITGVTEEMTGGFGGRGRSAGQNTNAGGGTRTITATGNSIGVLISAEIEAA